MRKHPKCIDYKDYIVRDSEYVQTSLLQTRDIMRQFGKSYFLATKFLPKRKKLAVYNLYKLVRIPDLVVDTPHIDSIQAKKDLQELYSHRLYVYNEKSYSDRIFGQAVHSFYQFDIKSTYVDAFFGAMWMDTDLTRYQSYRQLCDYMY
ncbi:squalene/phytoene synthase family protein [bacterium]|nr:squalene/phytoene synthase family protein [bacterium]